MEDDPIEYRLGMAYEDRAEFTKNSAARRLFSIMAKKKSNLALAADFYDLEQLFNVIDEIGPKIAVLKTHMDLMNYTKEYDIDRSLSRLREAAKGHKFMIFEDRKFADIGGVVKRQYEAGAFKIVDWSHLTNAHVWPGPGVITGLYEAAQPYLEEGGDRGLILLPYMTPKGNLFNKDIAQKIIDMGKEYPEFVMGWIGAGNPTGYLEHEVKEVPLGTLIMTPGCKLPGGASDNIKHGQQYTDPENLISRGSDVIIVGSGIYKSENPAEFAEIYRNAGWEAYETRLERH
jgi:uridine monophosphate synthetase